MVKKEYQTQRLVLRVSKLVTPAQTLLYYQRNETFFTPLDPKRPASFYTLPYQRMMLANDEEERQCGTGLKFWVSTRERPDLIIGMVSFSNIVGGSVCSAFLAYKLDRDYLNQGYITEAIALGVRVMFEEYRLHRIELAIMPRNLPSIRVAEKLGFVQEGYSPEYLEINGVWEDHLRFGLVNDTEEKWRQQPAYQFPLGAKEKFRQMFRHGASRLGLGEPEHRQEESLPEGTESLPEKTESTLEGENPIPEETETSKETETLQECPR